MRPPGLRWALAAVAAVAVAVVPAAPASAALSATGAVSQAVATVSLADPTGLTAAETACAPQGGVEVTLTWDVDPAGADGIEVRRSEDAGATFAVVASVPPDATGWVDTTAAFSTSYVYSAVTTRGPWTSAGATTASLTTSPKSCNAVGGPGGGGPGGGGRP